MPAIAPGGRLEDEDDATGVAEVDNVGVDVEEGVVIPPEPLDVAGGADPVTLTVTVAVAAKDDIDSKASCGTA